MTTDPRLTYSKPSTIIRPPKELGAVVWEEGPNSRDWLGLFC